MRIPSDPEEILHLLSELTTTIRDGLEIGSQEVRDYFDRQSRKLAPYFVENVPVFFEDAAQEGDDD